ncbi:MAG: DsbA family protein [Pseudonocardiaceae bacterium]
MGKNTKISIMMVAAVALVIAGFVALTGPEESAPSTTTDPTRSSELLVRPDSHRLSTAPDGEVTFVEFLDFECEACGAAYPLIEELRTEYQGRVTFVARYFPLSSHFNSERAARAVEAAAQQGRFEQMYQRMFETQTEWAEQQTGKDAVFRGFAADLGLDMAAYDRAYSDPATLERIRRDQADGEALGVKGTPTFFLDGEKLEPQSSDDLRNALDAALGS